MKPDKIILHHSATADSGTVSWNAIRRYYMVECCWADIGYHFGIEHVADSGDPAGSYEILIGRVADAQGAHTQGENHRSIGICFVGQFDAVAVPVGQWKRGLTLVAWLLREFGLKPEHVFGHRDFANKTCPGKMFDLNKFRAQLVE
jgi:hypothetical protein